MGEPAKFRTITIGGFYMLAVQVNGRVHMLHPQARAGDRFTPGQRMPQR
jgi:hypothetical protein